MAKKRYTILLVPSVYGASLHLLPHGRRVARQADLVSRMLAWLRAQPDMEGIVIDDQNKFFDDIAEIVPGLSNELAEATREGRLVSGPWYVSTLGMMVSGEALLRNLEFGQQTIEGFGVDAPTISFAPPTGNFVRQIPQILAGFGIELAFVDSSAMGGNSLYSTMTGPDGTELPVVRTETPEIRIEAGLTDEKRLRDALVAARDGLKDLFNSSVQIAMMPIEAIMADSDPLLTLEQATKRLRSSNVQFGSLSRFQDVIQTNYQPDGESTIKATDIVPYVPARLDGVLSSRIWIAQENADLQTLLARWAEPLHAWAQFAKSDVTAEGPANIPLSLLRQAWKHLLQDQAYAEISGAWVDEIETEIEHRFDEARHLSEEVLDWSLASIIEAIDTSGTRPAKASTALVVINTNGFTGTDRVSAKLVIDERHWPFEIVDTSGDAVPFQVTNYQISGGGLEVEVDLRADSVAGIGYQTYYVLPAHEDRQQVPAMDNGVSISNEFMEVAVDPQTGTLTLLDRERGITYEGLNHFVDCGDSGSVLQFGAVPRDTIIDIAANTPLSVTRAVSQLGETLEFFQIYRLPIQLADDRGSRLPLAAQFAPLSIRTQVHLTYGIPRADIEVEIGNDARDHRLQVHFPLPYEAVDGWVDTHFEVAHIPFTGSTNSDRVAKTTNFAQQGFVSLCGSLAGLTVASRGLPEGSFVEGEGQSVLTLTLLRSVGRIDESGQPEMESQTAQCSGTFNYHYSLIPHGENPEDAWGLARSFDNPMHGMQTGLHTGGLPTADQFMGSDTDTFVLSAVRATQDSEVVLVRGYSTSNQAEDVWLSFGLSIVEAVEVSLRGDIVTSIAPLDDHRLQFVTGPHEIKTFLIRLAR